jgi:predicted nucleic acid-binding protein
MAGDPGIVLVDTSAWIDAFRARTPWVTALVRRLLDEDRAATCGPVRFEIRRGLRPSERRRVLPLLEALHPLPFEESDWTEAGELDSRLRTGGHTLPPLDVVIAHLCLRHRVSLLTLDQHFASVSGLRIVPGP